MAVVAVVVVVSADGGDAGGDDGGGGTSHKTATRSHAPHQIRLLLIIPTALGRRRASVEIVGPVCQRCQKTVNQGCKTDRPY